MSRSRKKAILKDVGNLKRNYWKIIRRVNKKRMKYNLTSHYEYKFTYHELDDVDSSKFRYIDDLHSDDPQISSKISWEYKEYYDIYCKNLKIFLEDELEEGILSPKELVNDYDYRDYTTRPEFKSDLESKIKYRRK